jgi:hypothetical protein
MPWQLPSTCKSRACLSLRWCNNDSFYRQTLLAQHVLYSGVLPLPHLLLQGLQSFYSAVMSLVAQHFHVHALYMVQ